jgi:hypothetical protein
MLRWNRQKFWRWEIAATREQMAPGSRIAIIDYIFTQAW